MRERIRDIDRLLHIEECIDRVNLFLDGKTFEKTKVEKKANKMVFPKIPANYKPSDNVMDMVLGSLPSDVNLEKECKKTVNNK